MARRTKADSGDTRANLACDASVGQRWAAEMGGIWRKKRTRAERRVRASDSEATDRGAPVDKPFPKTNHLYLACIDSVCYSLRSEISVGDFELT
jgi:hypothetical protein